jgi:hypothetical protein
LRAVTWRYFRNRLDFDFYSVIKVGRNNILIASISLDVKELVLLDNLSHKELASVEHDLTKTSRAVGLIEDAASLADSDGSICDVTSVKAPPAFSPKQSGNQILLGMALCRAPKQILRPLRDCDCQ